MKFDPFFNIWKTSNLLLRTKFPCWVRRTILSNLVSFEIELILLVERMRIDLVKCLEGIMFEGLLVWRLSSGLHVWWLQVWSLEKVSPCLKVVMFEGLHVWRSAFLTGFMFEGLLVWWAYVWWSGQVEKYELWRNFLHVGSKLEKRIQLGGISWLIHLKLLLKLTTLLLIGFFYCNLGCLFINVSSTIWAWGTSTNSIVELETYLFTPLVSSYCMTSPCS